MGGARKGDDQVYNTIASWLQTCHSAHTRCGRPDLVLKRQLDMVDDSPARLLEMYHDGALSVRVVDTVSLPSRPKYATLSHCWGGHLPMKLTSETKDVLRQGSSCSSLPPTFRDAVQVAHRLDLSYIWIDALCIIQDSDEDWRTEAQKMAQVYAHAYVNLAATAAKNSEGGLFCQQASPLNGIYEFISSGNGLPSDCGKLHMRSWELWNRQISEAPLNRRGWVFQERLLAPRTIHFAKELVYWACSGFLGSEATSPESGLLRHEDAVERFFGTGDWMNLVEMYSKMAFTKSTDRLIAFAGVARLFRHVHAAESSRYIAGLWADDFDLHALWSTDKAASRPGSLLAPSWSWASVESAIRTGFITARKDTFCRVQHMQIAGESKNEFGFIAGARLTLSATIMSFQSLYDFKGHTSGTVCGLTFNEEPSPIFALIGPGSDHYGLNAGQATQVWDEPEYEDGSCSPAVWFLPTLAGYQYERHKGELRISGLLIEKVGGEDGVYKRVGVMKLCQEAADYDPEIWQRGAVRDSAYVEAGGNGEQEIVLV